MAIKVYPILSGKTILDKHFIKVKNKFAKKSDITRRMNDIKQKTKVGTLTHIYVHNDKKKTIEVCYNVTGFKYPQHPKYGYPDPYIHK